jgi:hypothetical protein
VGVMQQQITWMNSYGVDFIVFDWYWNALNQVYMDHAVQTYLQASNRDQVKFALLWANEAQKTVPTSLSQFNTMVQYWISNYFGKAQYLKIENKPVVIIFSVEKLRTNAALFGKTMKDLIDSANNLAKQAGYPGVYFVAATEAVEYWVKWFNPDNGFSALSAYNYHRGFSGVYLPLKPFSHSYEELDAGYRESWDWILKATTLPYFVPTTTGWDKRPWGGSVDPLHDQSYSTPAQFKAHLQAAKARIDQYPTKTLKTLLICCWNEYGEGSVLEPTKKHQFQYLEAVRSVFGSQRPVAPSLLQGSPSG